jgi:imidazolonepropionase-like amidohydrolase
LTGFWVQNLIGRRRSAKSFDFPRKFVGRFCFAPKKMEVFRGRLVLLEDGLGPATIVIKDGRIVDVHRTLEIPTGKNVINAVNFCMKH